MIGVIPFISKILESCKHSLAYQPPNPWTMGILELLAEVYAMPNLKLYLKFEIEVLFKNLDVDIKSVCPTSLLNNRARIIEGNPDFSQQVNHAISSVRSSVNQVELSPEAVRLSYQSGLLNTSYQRPGQLHLSAITLGVPDNQLSSAQGLPVAQNPYVLPAPELNAPQFQCFFLITHMRSVLSMAMEKAVEKLLSTVVKRIVSIATQTTINLVLKDYVTDPHDNSIHSASSFMVAQLAGNLSYVTCKERLRSQMSTQLRNSLLGLNISSEYLEPVMQQVINENLDLGCASIEKAAMEEGLILVRRELIRHLTKINISATPEEFDIKSGQLYLPGWANLSKKLHLVQGLILVRRELIRHLTKINISAAPEEFDLKSGQLTYRIEDPLILTNFQNFASFYHQSFNQDRNTHISMGTDSEPQNSAPSNAENNFEVREQTSFQPSAPDLFTSNSTEPSVSTGGASDQYQSISQKADTHSVSGTVDKGPESSEPDAPEFHGQEHAVSGQCHQHEDPPSFHDIDRYTDLVFSSLKGSIKLFLLSKVLEVIVTFIIRDAKEKKNSFRPKPFSRLFINFFIHIDTLESIIDDTNFKVLKTISNSLRSLQPAKVPAFGHKDFMPKLLNADDQSRWQYFLNLLVDFLRFMEPSFRTPEQKEPVNLLYEETCRLLLALLEEFPEFLCCYHFSLCDVIPSQCVELRNAILCAIPRNMRNPDHHTTDSKVNLYAEMNQPPCILSDFDASLKASNMKREVDEYLTTRQKDLPFLSQLKNKLLLREHEAKRSGTRYDVPLINSLVLYVGTKAIEQLYPSTTPHSTSAAKGAPLIVFYAASALDIFQTLILDLDTEGRYAFFNAVANNLRYPNNHTNYFKFILLYFFRKINQEVIQAQITRVLLGYLITHRPHPWGVLVTFLDLTTDPKYKFWSLSFTTRDPEIKRIINLVTSYLVSSNPVEDDVGTSGTVPEKMP
uniref:CCR4-NOT transcription complex subunit 1-like n=1 Tax=Erigeron canadensis TaxID=72917 RepID=UPI001CB9AA3A|nr:CCR4-NOT transcription complex subunit 1-like [Erigeron canadensis]